MTTGENNSIRWCSIGIMLAQLAASVIGKPSNKGLICNASDNTTNYRRENNYLCNIAHHFTNK